MINRHMGDLENILLQIDKEISNHKKVINDYVKEIVDILNLESDTYLDAGLELTHYDIPLSARSLVLSKVQEELTDRALREKI
jgi:Na+/phosphate symporter